MVSKAVLLTETPNYEKGDFGLPVPIWIGSDERAPHNNPRIKIELNQEIPVQLTPTGVEITISNKNILPEIGFDGKDFKKLATWFIAYRDIISSYHYVVCNMGAKKVKNPNETLKHALKDRYQNILKNGISTYTIPFHVIKPYVAKFDNITEDTRQYMNYLHNFEKQEKEQEEEIKKTIKEYQILSGKAVD